MQPTDESLLISWPKGALVNDGVDKNSYLRTDFNLSFPTIDMITRIKKIVPGVHLFKMDISWAFQHICMDPCDYHLLGLKWQNNAFIDIFLPFGIHHGMPIFQRVSDTVHFLICQHGYIMLNYVDDLTGVAMPSLTTFNIINDLGNVYVNIGFYMAFFVF